MSGKPRLGGIVFVETIAQEQRDRATLAKFVQRLRNGEALDTSDAKHYAVVLERFLAGYPKPRNRPAQRVRYWRSALYWLLHDEGDQYAANHVAAWCRGRKVDVKAATVERDARSAQGRAAGDRVRKSVKGHEHFDHASVVAAHRVAIEERILAWHHKDDDFGIVREHRTATARA